MVRTHLSKGLGFTNVQIGVDSGAAPSQNNTTVTKVSVPDGQYGAGQLITLYHAPAAPTTQPSTQCDPQQDPNCQTAPGNTTTSTQGSPGGGLLGGPTAPTTTKGHG